MRKCGELPRHSDCQASRQRFVFVNDFCDNSENYRVIGANRAEITPLYRIFVKSAVYRARSLRAFR